MPRIGIAYRPTDKTVIRMGAGWFDNIQHLNTFTIFNLMPPKAGSQAYQTSYVAGQTVPVNAVNGQNGQCADVPVRPNFSRVDLKRSVPHEHRRSFRGASDRRRLPSAGLQGRRCLEVELRFATRTAMEHHRRSWLRRIKGVAHRQLGHQLERSCTPVAVFSQNLRPYPQFFDPARPDLGVQSTGRIRYIDSYGEGFYHGLQAKFDKRTSHDLSFGVAYTYSKSHGDGEAGGQEGASFQNPRDRQGSRGVYSFDQTHRTVANFVWELPGRTMKGFVGTVIGGWQLNGILTIASGFPFTITQGAGDLGLPNGSVRPDVVGTAELDNPTRKLWFNPQAYQRVTCQIASRQDLCHLGSAGYDQLRGPGQRNLDFSMFKNFPSRSGTTCSSDGKHSTLPTHRGSATGRDQLLNANQITPNGTRDGEIRSIQTPMRRMQFGLKFRF